MIYALQEVGNHDMDRSTRSSLYKWNINCAYSVMSTVT
ncbi:hypothetical protein K239x_24760 [Planctomycetes bacterium K23_9]|uniref:Uncharacterized protein n=1 Tax=Stieleria marina TaxID=1930275 RepID=A0A517NTS6_9BACT|nr:hypothetical protein K239x_24760 [Planctomycetes bacterium K23_9]